MNGRVRYCDMMEKTEEVDQKVSYILIACQTVAYIKMRMAM